MISVPRMSILIALLLAAGPTAFSATQVQAEPAQAAAANGKSAKATDPQPVMWRLPLTQRFLSEVNSASRALGRHESKAALDILNDADALLNTIRGSGDPRFATVGAVSRFYEEVDDVPVEKAQGASSKATAVPVVTEEDRLSLRVRLDLSLARANLDQARSALRAGDASKADSLLRAIPAAGIVVDAQDRQSPRVAAAANFDLAWQSTFTGDWDAARAAFDQAIKEAKAAARVTAKAAAAQHSSAPKATRTTK